MFYPIFSRRMLALILSCLVITLGGVGLFFLIYIFNHNSSLLSGPLEKISHSHSQPYKHSVLENDENQFEKKLRYQRTDEIKGELNRENIYKNRSSLFPTSREGQVILFSPSRVENNNERRTINLSTNESRTTDVNLDTIYIDDFDRPKYNRENKNEVGSVDFFDVILVDHKLDKKLISLNTASNYSMKYKNIISETIKDYNNKRKKYKNKPVTHQSFHDDDYSKVSIKEDGRNRTGEENLYLLDADSTGSGSGDYTDDTESNIIRTKFANMYDANNAGKVLKKKKNRKQRRWKDPYYFFENYGKSSSSLSGFTTLSYADNSNQVNEMEHLRHSTNLSARPIFSSQVIGRKKSAPLQKEQYKKTLSSNGFTIHEVFFNDSYKTSSNFPNGNDQRDHLQMNEFETTMDDRTKDKSLAKQRESDASENDESWMETRTRRLMGNVKKSEERSRQLLLCEEAGGGELCRMLFKEHVSD